MFIRCCFLVHYWFCRLCTLPSLKCIMLNDQQHFIWNIWVTQVLIDVFECLYVHWFTCYFKALYQYLYHIIFWYIYECVMTSGGEVCILLEMWDNQHLVLTRNHRWRLSECSCATTTATICNNTDKQRPEAEKCRLRKCPTQMKCKKTSNCHLKDSVLLPRSFSLFE